MDSTDTQCLKQIDFLYQLLRQHKLNFHAAQNNVKQQNAQHSRHNT